MSEEVKDNSEEITTSELEAQLASQNEPSESLEEFEIPKKFVGQSFDEVVKAYSGVEKVNGKLSSELEQVRKEREQFEARLKELEARTTAIPTQQSYQPQAAPEAETDPLSDFDNSWDDDPREAVKRTLQREREQRAREAAKQQAEASAKTAAEYYQKQKTENPDYARREPVMQQILQKYATIFNPNMVNSREVLELLDMASRGSDIEHYMKEAVAKAKEQKQTDVDRKEAAFSESPVGDGEQSVNVDDIPLDQLEKMLSRS